MTRRKQPRQPILPPQTTPGKAPWIPTRTLVTPSPRDLVDRLDTDERVAIDHILEKHLDTSWDPRRPIGEDLPNVNDPTLVALVSDKKRRTFLLGLTTQLRALGVTLDDTITARERKDPQ